MTNTDKSQRSLALILNQFYLFHASSVGVECTIWGDKTPLNTLYLDRIKSVFPNAKYIHIVRDGCDVVSSYLRENLYSDVRSAANRWMCSINAAETFISKNKENSIEIRYEHLVGDTYTEIFKICEFLNVNFSPDMIHDLGGVEKMGDAAKLEHHSTVKQPISSNSIGKGRTQFSNSEKQILDKLISGKLIQLGYDPVL